MKELIDIQNELKAGKSEYNTFGNYPYRSCESILEALKPLLKKHNMLLNISDSIEMIGNRFYVKSTVLIASIETPSTRCEVSGWAREAENKKGMDAAQITGAASSYARKYALCGLFLIDDGVDVDAQDNTAEPEPPPKPVDNRDPEEETNKFFKDLPNRDKPFAPMILKIRKWIDTYKYVSEEHYEHVTKNFEEKEKEFWHKQESEGK